jgi:hypothetical protein
MKIKLIELFKVCTKCEDLKPWGKFHKDKKGRFGVKPKCKVCNCLDATNYQKENPEQCNERSRKWAEENPEKIKLTNQKWYKKNHAKVKKNSMAWRKRNPDKYLKNVSGWQKEKRKSDPKFKLKCQMSVSICLSLKGNKNGRKWEGIIGYTLNQLKKHIEKQFTDGMSWNNYGDWHIDHKIPISAFNFTIPEHEDFKRCWALSNLQPLWAHDNLTKQASLYKHFQPSLLI